MKKLNQISSYWEIIMNGIDEHSIPEEESEPDEDVAGAHQNGER